MQSNIYWAESFSSRNRTNKNLTFFFFQTEEDLLFWSYTVPQDISEDIYILPKIQCSEQVLDHFSICTEITSGLY